jgi:glyoxylase-like metal-dependent hydrolase (beta-lactamase superfamily II)
VLRWKIGDATITSIVELETPTSPRFLFADLSKKAVLDLAVDAPWLLPHFVDGDGYLLQKIQTLVVEVSGLRIAVDTCIGNHKTRANPGWHRLQLPFLEDLAAAGYPPESVDYVVCTHLHVDHVGWNTKLVDGRWVPTFPNARYLFVRPELEYWQVTPYDGGDDIFGDSVAPIVGDGLADLVGSDHRVCDEVHFESTPGHTPAHISVVVESQGQRAVITGDMVHTPVQMVRPELSSAFDYDPVESQATRRTSFARWADGETLVIGTHFGTPTAGFVHGDGPDRWRFEVAEPG